jgi:hypothetical protein
MRVLLLPAVIVTLLAICWCSLIATSDPLESGQLQIVNRAVAKVEAAGFSKEAFVLRHLATYRATDGWWNAYLGHSNAYGATNFPFEVVTIYRPFFTVATDDTERAAILLHEAQHLLGSQEAAALGHVWLAKRQLGWTADAYGETRLWKNTKEWTELAVPALFRCGFDGRSDCVD